MPAVTVSEFASYVQQDVDTATATLLLGLAEGMVAEIVGAALPDPATPAQRAVILEAVRRAYVNPEGWTSEQIDDWAGRRDPSDVGLFVTDSERATLLPGASDAFTIRAPARGYVVFPGGWA